MTSAKTLQTTTVWRASKYRFIHVNGDFVTHQQINYSPWTNLDEVTSMAAGHRSLYCRDVYISLRFICTSHNNLKSVYSYRAMILILYIYQICIYIYIYLVDHAETKTPHLLTSSHIAHVFFQINRPNYAHIFSINHFLSQKKDTAHDSKTTSRGR